jgi:hypothetical protein
MSTESIILSSNVTEESVPGDSSFKYSAKQKGAGYHKYNDGIHTAVYQVDSFVGTIKLQATLELYPGDTDWVDIVNTEVAYGSDSTQSTGAQSVTFTGKFVWVRAAYNLQNGTISQIRYNY